MNVDVGANSVVTGAGSLGGAIRFETVEAADLLADGENLAQNSNGAMVAMLTPIKQQPLLWSCRWVRCFRLF